MTGSATAAARRALGAYGESLAARHLVEVQGMVLLDRNWRCDAGEIASPLVDFDFADLGGFRALIQGV